MVQDKLHLSSGEGAKAIDATFGCQTRETGLFHSQAVRVNHNPNPNPNPNPDPDPYPSPFPNPYPSPSPKPHQYSAPAVRLGRVDVLHAVRARLGLEGFSLRLSFSLASSYAQPSS